MNILETVSTEYILFETGEGEVDELEELWRDPWLIFEAWRIGMLPYQDPPDVLKQR